MTRIRKVYMPLWVAWFAQACILPMWVLVTYRTFFSGRSEVSVGAWVLVTIFCAVMSAMLLLMGYRTLPVQIIEEEDQ